NPPGTSPRCGKQQRRDDYTPKQKENQCPDRGAARTRIRELRQDPVKSGKLVHLKHTLRRPSKESDNVLLESRSPQEVAGKGVLRSEGGARGGVCERVSVHYKKPDHDDRDDGEDHRCR